MVQRIGLAQALLNDPKLVFLDEPTSGLDPLGRRLVRDIIHDLRQRGTAVFLNSHLLSEVEKTCDRVAFIRNGKVLQTVRLDEWNPEAFQVTLRVGQPTNNLLDKLSQFGKNIEMEMGNGRIHLTLSHEKKLPELSEWLISQGHTLYELTPTRLSLEERFLQIIGSED